MSRRALSVTLLPEKHNEFVVKSLARFNRRKEGV